jgi:uncharacterized protein
MAQVSSAVILFGQYFFGAFEMKFSASTTTQLGHYVYALVDSRTQSIFYIGKASANNRAFNHFLGGTSEKKKHARIEEIRATGFEPEVEILRYGLKSTSECFEVEAALIDAVGLENLTNEIRGHGIDRGRQKAADVERLHGSKPIAVESIIDPYMLFFINQSYSPTQTEQELYDATRQFWYQVSPSTRVPAPETGMLRYPIALAVVDSVVVRAYSILAWFPAGSTLSSRAFTGPSKKWEFIGQLQTSNELVGKRLTKAGNNLPANQLGFGYLN